MRNNIAFCAACLFLLSSPSCGSRAVRSQDTEMEKVIKFYSKRPSDSLKLKAAKFLIADIDGWYYYEGDLLSRYQDYLKLIRKDQDHGEYFLQSFNMLYGPFSYEYITKKYDSETLSSTGLIGNIEMAFKAWQEQPWGKDIDFGEFCEYILPFRIDNEIPEYNRKEIYEQFDPVLAQVKKEKGGDVVAAGAALNDSLGKYKWIFSLRASFLPHFRPSQIIKYRVGSCREMTDLAFYTMRAAGIPVAIDFIPQWPYRSMGHEFNVLLDKNGRSVMFLGSEDSPGTPHKPGVKMGKVYRHVYTKNRQSLAMIKGDSDLVPRLFQDPRLRDVTDEYVRSFDLRLRLRGQGSAGTVTPPQKFAYICVYNNTEWVPVGWGRMEGGKRVEDQDIVFPKLEGNIAYMPCWYIGSRMVPAGDPLILDKEGKPVFLRPDAGQPIREMNLTGIFPLLPDDFDNWHMGGCRFQGATKANFEDAQDLYTIPEKPNPFWNEIGLTNSGAFRFVRYLGKGYTHMGEMEFYQGKKKLTGQPMGTKTGWYASKTFDKAMDNDIFTAFDPAGASTDSTWVGLDLGHAEKIDRIRFSAPVNENLKTDIIPHHQYELLYWDDDKWVSAGMQLAHTPALTFSAIPSHTLYMLKDRTEKAEARIFTYEKGKQVWW